ncbi:hypothetical protein HPB51_023669 [Rhipicephalus microplus]|uniref:Uncharacterized protein n=1 Tax=Rhipicephalus microplus TaxID=6941 RepID=A0A9J6DKD0_RHIMP|nr:hypothetical protein HPB51_023669 [Rhipicephalus microplus]
MPSTWQKEPRPVTHCSEPWHRSSHRNGRPTKPATSLTYLQRTYQSRETQGSHEPAAQTSAADHEQLWSKAPATKGKNFLPKKHPITRKQTAAAIILRTPAILQNRSPCHETEIQASSSNEVGYPEKTECELSSSPQKSNTASSGSSAITETSSPTSSSSWSHNTLAPSPNTPVEESSPEQKEQGSSSLLVNDHTGTPGKAALSTPPDEGEKQVFLPVPTTPLSRPSTQLRRRDEKRTQRISRNAPAPPCSQQLCAGAARGTTSFTAINWCSKRHKTLRTTGSYHQHTAEEPGGTKTCGFNPKLYPTLSATCEPWVHFPAGNRPLRANSQEKLLSVCDKRGYLRTISGS